MCVCPWSVSTLPVWHVLPGVSQHEYRLLVSFGVYVNSTQVSVCRGRGSPGTLRRNYVLTLDFSPPPQVCVCVCVITDCSAHICTVISSWTCLLGVDCLADTDSCEYEEKTATVLRGKKERLRSVSTKRQRKGGNFQNKKTAGAQCQTGASKCETTRRRLFFYGSTDGSGILMWQFRLWDVQDVALFLSMAIYICDLGKQIQHTQHKRGRPGFPWYFLTGNSIFMKGWGQDVCGIRS